jgi:CIC family chloride channel protein
MQFSPIVISSVTATVLSRHVLGDSPAFVVPQYDLLRALEFVPYTVLGLLAGLTAAAFIFSVYRTQDLFASLGVPPWLKPAIGGLAVGVIALVVPEVLGVGYLSVDSALHDRVPMLLLLVLIPAKMLATSATLGSGGSGGIFAPSLFVGAMLGGAVGHVAGLWLPGIASPGAYALVGMGAVVAGATHGPISAILIIFELTGDYRIFPPLMVACILSVLLSTWLQRDSMYTKKLAKRGINLHEGKDVNVLRSLSVRDVYDPSPSRVPASLDIHEVVERMLHDSRENFFVVGRDDRLVGSFSLKDLRELMFEGELPPLTVAADVARSDAQVVRMDDNLDLVMHVFGQHDVEEIGVVERGPGHRLLGSVRRKQVIDAYNREIFRVDLAGGFHSVATAVEHDRGVELAAGYRLVEVGAPYAFVGRTIRRINVRARYGVEIILIRKPPEGTGDIPSRPGAFPHPGYRLETGDTLLVMGTEENIRRFRDALPAASVQGDEGAPGDEPPAGV